MTTHGYPEVAQEVYDFLSPSQGPGEIGRLGGYRVLKLLGAGGMGIVLQAEDAQLQRPIALKVMMPSLAKDPSARQRFLREARAAAALRSDHVVTIHQVGEDHNVVFLAMEFLEGMSLDAWLKMGRQPTFAQAARIGRQVALGLAAAHERGLIHRDVKPGNVWLESTHQGRAKLLDFGLAHSSVDDPHLTQSGAIVGTPAYMAPEQARGEKIDSRADLFGLGVVLYRLCTGRLPFQGDNTTAVLMALALDQPTPPREVNPAVPPRLAALIERLLSKDRAQRPATAKAVAAELADIEREVVGQAESLPTVRQAESLPPSSRRPPWRRRFVAAGLLFLMAGMAAGIVVIIRDKQGKEVARVNVPEGGKAEIEDGAKEQPAPREGRRIEPSPLAPLLPGESLAPTALVREPAKLPGVRSWTIERRNAFGPRAMAYRPDGKRLAVGGLDGCIRIWEPQSARLVQVLYAPRSFLAPLAWSPDGRTLAAGTRKDERPVRLWDAETGRFLRDLATPAPMEIHVLAWSPDGRSLLATSFHNGDCLAWNAADGKLLRKVPIRGQFGAFAPDGKRLAGTRADLDGIAIWDVETGKEVRKLTGFKGDADTLAWSPDGKRLACSGAAGVRVWEVETGKAPFQRKDDLESCSFVQWSPDGRALAVGLSARRGVAVVEVAADGKLRGLQDFGTSIAAWSPDGKTIARASDFLRLYDAATGKRLQSLGEAGYLKSFAWSPTGPALATNDEDSQTLLRGVDTGEVFATLKGSSSPLAWSPDGKTAVTGGPDHVLILWESSGKMRGTLSGHQGNVSVVAWSPDGKRLASSSSEEKRVRLWDAERGAQIRALGPFAGPAEKVRWSPDGRLVAFNVPGVGWHFWDVTKNQLVNDPKQWKVARLHFAPDGRTALVLPKGADTYRLRDLDEGKEHAQLPSTRPQPPAWSPDGRLLAVPVGATVELWRGDLRRRVRTLRGSLADIQTVAFSSDGKLVAGRADDRLHLWETDTGRLRGILLLGECNNGLTITAEGH